MDRIDLRGLRVHARHGVLPHEARDGQEFVLDVAIERDLRLAGTTDDLDDTVDYGEVAARVHELVADGPRRDLIETVAEDVARLVLDLADARAVEVAVHKPHAPVPVAVDDVVVTIRRTRPEA